MSSAKRTTLNLGRRVVFATGGLMMVALAWPCGWQSQACLGAESPSALETDPHGWADILPQVDLKGWYRVAVPPTGKLGRPQWHAEPDRKMLVCDGDGGHDMLLFEKEFGDALFHFEFRYVPVKGKTGYNSGAYVRNSRDGAIWHQAQFGNATGGYLFGETPTTGGKKKFFSLATQVKDSRVKPAGQWNTLEITARAKTVTLWVNGAVTCQFLNCAQEKGHVGLEGEGYQIEFRNLKVKELKPPTAKPRRVDAVLAAIKPLADGRKTQLPLYLWPAMDPGPLDAASAERLVEELNRRGVGLVCSWAPRRAEATLAQGLVIARAQTRLGQAVSVDATACLQSFFNGDKSTAHVDADGHPFWDDSFNFGKTRYPIGCPFTLEARIAPIREQVESFVRAYQAAGMKIDFIFADWEIDGPLDYNRAHEAARRCRRCRTRIAKIDDFLEFQKVVRALRSQLQRRVLSTPVLDRFPHALVGNYAVYPHNGYRYWYDFFEQFVEGQPHIADQRARYRAWAHEFPSTGYTMAMPVLYTWYPTFQWYDFAETDYRWFYNMLLVTSNVGRSTPRQVPIVSFVHWHTTAPPPNPDPQVKAMSRQAYQELLWHALLRGARTFYLWCPAAEDVEECQAVHEVYAAAQEYAEFIDRGVPVAFEVPKQPGPVVSGLLLEKRLLVRRTDFGPPGAKAEITVAGQRVSVPLAAGKCQIITVP